MSWSTILNKRETTAARSTASTSNGSPSNHEDKIAELLTDAGILRNRLKVRGTVSGARAFIATQLEFGSFADYLWTWVDGIPIVNRPRSMADLPTHTELSDRLGKELKRRGFTFVGTTIMYSYLQAVGLIDDHLVGCPWKTGA